MKLDPENVIQVSKKDKDIINEKNNDNGENLHPLEIKYGKEPKIDPEDLLRWH